MTFKEFAKMSPSKAQELMSTMLKRVFDDVAVRKKIGICIVATIVFGFGAYFANKYLHGSISNALSQHEEHERIEKYLKEYNDDAKAYKEEMTKINAKIIEEKDLDKANLFVQKLAETNNISIQNAQRVEKTKAIGSGISAQTTKMVLNGTYSDLIKFLHGVENASFFTCIDGFSANVKNKTTSSDAITANVSYMVFFQKAGGSSSSSDEKGGKKNERK